jgi:hypothetical protein
MSMNCGIKLWAAFADGPPTPRLLRVAQTGGGGKLRLLLQDIIDSIANSISRLASGKDDYAI